MAGLARAGCAARRAGGRVLNMKRRKGIIALIAATVGLGVAAIPAVGRAALRHRRPRHRPAHPDDRRRAPGRIRSARSRSPASPARSSRSSTTASSAPRRRTRRRRPSRASRRSRRPAVPGHALPHLDAHPGRQRGPRRAEPDTGRREPPTGSTGAREGRAQQLLQRRQPQRQEDRRPARAQGARKAARTQQAGRTAGGAPTADNPTFSLAHARRRSDRRAELLHRQVPHPALPAPALPGRRHRVRRALGGARGDQRDRDRLRPQPQRLLRRRARLDAVHARHLEAVRRRRQQGRAPGSLQPRRRHLRRRALPQGRRRRAGPAQGDLRLQPRRLVRRLRPHARAPDRRPAVQLRRLAHRPDPGPLPRRGEGDLRRRPHRARRQEARQALAQAG